MPANFKTSFAHIKAAFFQEQHRFETRFSIPSFLASLGDRKTIYGYSEIMTTQIGCKFRKATGCDTLPA
jgi:hypothetical protein